MAINLRFLPALPRERTLERTEARLVEKKKRKKYVRHTAEWPWTETTVKHKAKPKARVAQSRHAAKPFKALTASFYYKKEQYCDSPFLKTVPRDRQCVMSHVQSAEMPV